MLIVAIAASEPDVVTFSVVVLVVAGVVVAVETVAAATVLEPALHSPEVVHSLGSSNKLHEECFELKLHLALVWSLWTASAAHACKAARGS